jgi:uncharacterized protein YkwD
MSRARTAALLVVLASLALPAIASASSAAVQMVHKVNSIRHAHGLRSVAMNRSLQHSAGAYAHHMMHSGYFGHASRIHASGRFRTLGEIIEMQRGGSNVGLAFNSWIHSPEHRSIILSGGFRFAGAGFVSGRFHGHRTTIWVMHFGRH